VHSGWVLISFDRLLAWHACTSACSMFTACCVPLPRERTLSCGMHLQLDARALNTNM